MQHIQGTDSLGGLDHQGINQILGLCPLGSSFLVSQLICVDDKIFFFGKPFLDQGHKIVVVRHLGQRQHQPPHHCEHHDPGSEQREPCGQGNTVDMKRSLENHPQNESGQACQTQTQHSQDSRGHSGPGKGPAPLFQNLGDTTISGFVHPRSPSGSSHRSQH